MQYLNAAQKYSLTMMLACGQFLDQALEQAQKMPKDIAADLKRGRSWVWRAATEWLKRYDERTHRAVLNIIKDCEIGIIAKQDKRQLEHLERYIGGREYAERLAEAAMQATCRTCDGACKDSCPLYEAYKHFDIPAWDEAHPHCEYAGAGSVGA